MRYRLRTLLIAFGMIAALAARTGYLIRQAVFHEREAERYTAKLVADWPVFIAVGENERGNVERRRRDLGHKYRHHGLAREYRRAVYRPWTCVDEARYALRE